MAKLLLLTLLFPLTCLSQDWIHKADLYTQTVLDGSKVCERQEVIWGTFTRGKVEYFCFALEDQEEHCFQLGTPQHNKALNAIEVAALDANRQEYGITIMIGDHLVIWISSKDPPCWLLSTRDICKEQLNFLTNVQTN